MGAQANDKKPELQLRDALLLVRSLTGLLCDQAGVFAVAPADRRAVRWPPQHDRQKDGKISFDSFRCASPPPTHPPARPPAALQRACLRAGCALA
jgi:hypothetical protein